MEKEREEKLINLIKNIDKYKECNIFLNTNLVEDLGFTSIDYMELICKIEEEFDIMFDFEDLDFEKIMFVSGLIETIERKF